MGKYNKDQVHLFINDKVPLMAQKPRHILYRTREKVSNELEMLRHQDIVEVVKDEPTPWTSPIVVAPKNHDKTKIRLCIDMREAKKAIDRTRYPSASLEDLVNVLQGSKLYCKLDMKNALLQFELDSASGEITTFRTHEVLHRFKRLNFKVFSTQTRSLEENTTSGIIERYKEHPSINLIKSKNSCLANTSSFMPVSVAEVKRAIEFLNSKKVAQEKDVHTNTLKQNSDFIAFHVQKDISSSVSPSKSPNDLKEADVILVYKKKYKLSEKNYRPVSILPNISKVYERCLYDQISKYYEVRFSKFQCSFRKGYNAQHSLLAMIEK